MICSFRVGELFEYWQYLHPDEQMMTSQYFKQVKTMEIGMQIFLPNFLVLKSLLHEASSALSLFSCNR